MRIQITPWHKTHCPYCVLPIGEHDIIARRGEFTVHTFCELDKKRSGGTYLLFDGSMKFRDHILDEDTARATVTLHMNFRRESKERERAEAARWGI